MSNHMLSKVKNFVRVVQRPARSIIPNTIEEVEEFNKDPNYFQKFFEELDLPEFNKDIVLPEDKKMFYEGMNQIEEQFDSFIKNDVGGEENFEENIEKDDEMKNEMIDAFDEIIKEEESKI